MGRGWGAIRYWHGAVFLLLCGYFMLNDQGTARAEQPAPPATGERKATAVGTADRAAIDARVESLFEQLLTGNTFKAARELGTLKDPLVVDRLLKMLDSSLDEGLRAAVIDALGDIGDRRAVDVLIRMLSDRTGSRPVPANPVNVDGGVAVLSFSEMSGGPVAMRRQSAAQALGKIRDERAVEPLRQAVEDENDALAIDAVSALAEIRSLRAVTVLIGALGSKKIVVRLQTVASLGEIQDERAILPLIKVLEDDPDKYVRDQAFNALHKFSFAGRPEAAARLAEGLMKLYRSGDKRDRVLSVWFLGDLKTPQAEDILLEASASPEADLREAAAAGLGHLGGPRALAALEQLAQDREAAVRQAAQKALAQGRGED